MALESDEARAAARRRLQARMQKRDSGNAVGRTTQASESRMPKLSTMEHPRKLPKRPSAKDPMSPVIAFSSEPAPPTALIAIAALLITGVLVIAYLTQCAVSAPADDSVVTQDFIEQEEPNVDLDLNDAVQSRLVELIGNDEATKLLSSARSNNEVLWIATHPDEYDADGIEVQTKLLKLAANEPAAVDYVRDWPSMYTSAKPSDDETIAMSTKSPSPDVPDTSVPHLYQWDKRWGYTTYSSASFGLTGCGPTALAMVAQTLTDRKDITPYEMGQLAKERGFMTEFQGTGVEMFTDMADEIGLSCETVFPTGDEIREALSTGAIIVANLGPGQFTDNGHYFVLAGITDDGKVIVNDPYSVERSSCTWDSDTIADESVALFAYTKQAED